MTNRELTGAPRLTFEVLLALGFAALMVWALPDITAWLRGEPPVTAAPLEACRADLTQARELAAHYASIVTGCLNHGSIAEGASVVTNCRPPR